MSTATKPFQLRNGFFPSCTTRAASSDYVVLNGIDSDNGLREAMRLFFFSERVTIVPSGTLTVLDFGTPVATDSFSQTFRFPDLISPTTGDGIYGSIVGGNPGNNNAISTVEPAFRACSGLTEWVVDYVQDYNDTTPFPRTEEHGIFRAEVAFQGGEWRLYFRFIFSLQLERAAYFGRLFLDSQNIMGTAPAGNIIFFGYSLPYYTYTTVSNAIRYSATTSGVSISATTEEWTF